MAGGRRAAKVLLGGSLGALLTVGIGTIPTVSGATTRSITIGASLPLTGPLGGLGSDQLAGYQQAVNDVNASGGLKVGGVRYKVRLVHLDNASDPTTASQQVRDLVTKDGAIALLGGATPPIAIPEADAAEVLHVPFVTTNSPIDAFAGGNPSGWKYSWDVFFKEQNQAVAVAKLVNLCATNKKVAVFTDTEQDGVFQRPLYKAAVKADGDKVVGDYTFPVDTTDFTSFITAAKAAHAQIVIGQMTFPAGVALMKQMKSLGFAPRVSIIAKASNAENWVTSLGSLAEGSGMELTWSPAAKHPGTAHLMATLGKRLALVDLASAVPDYGAAQVLLDAIAKAGSTSASSINAAIGRTNANLVVGHVKFAKNHTAVTAYAVGQWQHGKVVQVYPPVAGSKLECPMAGLR
jgi:branched-chain amino acid transport system substrate-binding protein